MKYVLEYGVRGGAHVDNVVIKDRHLAERLACTLVLVFTNKPGEGTNPPDWRMRGDVFRRHWCSATHFVALSKLDGVPRGSASHILWTPSNSHGMGVNLT